MDNLSDDQFDPAKIAETMKDKEAMKKAMEQIKEDKTMLPLVMKKFNSDQRIRRNLNNAAEQLKISREKKRTGRITGRLRTEEIKAQKREDISMAVAKSQAHFTEEDRTCVIISPKGIISPFYIKNREMIDEKYCMHSVYLSDTPFLILSPIGVGGKMNPKATSLLNEFVDDEPIVCYGHIIFVAGKTIEIPIEKEEDKKEDILVDSPPSPPSPAEPEENPCEPETYTKFEPIKISVKMFEELVAKEMEERATEAAQLL